MRRARVIQFDRAASVAASLAGQAQADEHADDEWKALARDAVLDVAARYPTFTADDVWQAGGLPRTRENRALGPVMAHLARQRLIVATGAYTRTSQVALHASPRRIWRATTDEERRT